MRGNKDVMKELSKRTRCHAAFTLVEVLVSISLVSLFSIDSLTTEEGIVQLHTSYHGPSLALPAHRDSLFHSSATASAG